MAGWIPDILERSVRLLLLLEGIDRHPLLHDKLLLKGGTALNLFHLPVPRLSVDIDLNYVGSLDLKETRAQRPEIERALTAVANSQDYGVSLSTEAHAGRKLYLQYTNLSGVQDRLEVDINYLFRLALFPPERRASHGLLPGFSVTYPLVNWKELIAGKCMAAIDRGAARDVYDLAKVKPMIDFGDASLRAAVIGLGAVLPHPLHTYADDRFKRMGAKQFETELRPFLRSAEKLNAEQIQLDAAPVLSWMKTLSDHERSYIDAIADGRIEPELVFARDPELCRSLKLHPALLWKIQNVRSHLRRKL